MKTRQATKEDFKSGTVLIDSKEGWKFSIRNKYDDGIWETRQGNVVFENEAHHYLVEVK